MSFSSTFPLIILHPIYKNDIVRSLTQYDGKIPSNEVTQVIQSVSVLIEEGMRTVNNDYRINGYKMSVSNKS